MGVTTNVWSVRKTTKTTKTIKTLIQNEKNPHNNRDRINRNWQHIARASRATLLDM